MRIGLPRALSFYEYGPLWRAFFEALGAEVVVSGPTTRATLEIATARATADLCFPAKVYIGHLLVLADQVDLVFTPSLRRSVPSPSAYPDGRRRGPRPEQHRRGSDTIATHCAKIVGLPDLARSVLPDPAQVLAVDLDLDKGWLALAQAAWAAGRPLTWNPVQIARAAEAAWGEYQASHPCPPSPLEGRPLTLAVVGHPYLLRDEYVNHNLLRRLEDLGVGLLTPEMLPQGAADRGVEQLTGEAYWAYAPALLGAGAYFLKTGLIDGLVAVVAFGCAPDSGLAPMLNQAARRARVPMLTLTLDEHSGEAGLVTRIEAFLDMLERKQPRLDLSKGYQDGRISGH